MSSPIPVGSVDSNPPIPLQSVATKGSDGKWSPGSTVTDAQRQAIYQYIADRTGTPLARIQAVYSTFLGDPKSLINDYIGLVNGATSVDTNIDNVPTPSNPLSSVEDFLGILTNGALWTRVAEFSLGFLLLGIAAYAVVRSTTGIRAPSPLGPAKTLVNATRSRPSAAPAPAPAPKPVRAPKPVASVYESRHAPSRVKPSGNYSSGKHSVDLSAPIL